MSATLSQAFRARLSSETILIPTRRDTKSAQRIVLWKDILRFFEHAKHLMHGQETVLFLTDDEFEDLIPLRIEHRPGVVLEVVMDGNQGDSNAIGVLGNTGNVVSDHSLTPSSSEVASVTRDVVSLRISEAGDNQSLVLPHPYPSEMAIQRVPITMSDYQPGVQENMTQQEQLHLLQQQMQQVHRQMEEILGGIQQISQHVQNTQQQMRVEMDTTLQQTQRSVQQLTQRFEETQPTVQSSDLHREQREEILQTSLQQLQQEMNEVQQKVQLLQQEVQESRAMSQESYGQLQQLLNEAVEVVQQTGQQYQQTQQPIQEKEKVDQDQGRLSLFDQFMHEQYRAQSTLEMPPQEVSFLRLFIILPESTPVPDGQGSSYPLQFRLHFLCECGTHPIPRSDNNPHEVHLTNHPGYILENQKEFIDKFGTYLLTTMTMVKDGDRVGGLVPPQLGLNHAAEDRANEGRLQFIKKTLWGLNHATEDHANERRLQFIKKNISQLVDDTITYLREAVGSIEDDASTPPQSLDDIDTTGLLSYLKVKDDECTLGGLSRMEIEDVNYTSICCDHLRDCYASSLQQLEHDTTANDGKQSGVRVKIMATSEAMIKLSKDALGELLKIQGIETWPLLTEINLKTNGHNSASNSTKDIFGARSGIESFSMDIGRLKVSASGLSREDVKVVAIDIHALKDLTLNDLELIQRCHPINLTISETPRKEDEDRLVSILQRNPSIFSLAIRCPMGRYTAFIDLVKSTRGKMLQSESRPRLIHLKLHDSENMVDVSFDDGLPRPSDVNTEMKSHRFDAADPAVSEFIREYGWSIKSLVVPETFTDHHASLLDESTKKRGSKISCLEITLSTLADPGHTSIYLVFKRSKDLTHLKLCLESLREGKRSETALFLLSLYKSRVKSIHMSDWCELSCLLQIMVIFPNRSRFTLLEEFSVDGVDWNDDMSNVAVQWINSVISAPSQQKTPLKVLKVKIDLQPQDWEAVIKAIDLSTQEELHFDHCNFSGEQLKLLTDRIADSKMSSLPLKLLNLKGSKVEKVTDVAGMSALLARIQEKAPQVRVEGPFISQR